MFRRKEDTLDPDPSFPADLKSLGFFINNLGHIRRIKAPDQEYVFRATNNDRVNNVYREAVQECMRQETQKRYEALGLQRLFFPDLMTEKPAGPHIPILAPAPDILKTRKRVIVLVNNLSQDLGILSYGQLQRELGLNGGSAVNFVKETIKRSAAGKGEAQYADIFKDGFRIEDTADVPGVVIANAGQLLYSHKYNKAMTLRSWDGRTRKSAMHAAVRIHDVENYVPGHRTPREHVKSIFDEVLCKTDRVAAGAEIYVVAIESGAENVLDLLKEDFTKYGSRITAMALIHSLMDDSQIKDPVLRTFLRQRAREWKISGLTTDPTSCVELPPDFHDKDQSAPTLEESYVPSTRVSWSENITNLAFKRGKEMTSTPTPHPGKRNAEQDMDELDGWAIRQAVICPTFAGGDSLSGENVFTNTSVQQAILTFFEGFARNPAYDHNSSIKLFNEAPKPTLENSLAFDPMTEPAALTSLPPAMTPEQSELDMARQALEHMKIAHEACTPTGEELQKGRDNLVNRIANQEARIDKLERETLAHGGLKSNESLDKRENWKPAPEGEQVSFAGTMVDSELLKAAGLGETAEDKLRKLHEKPAK